MKNIILNVLIVLVLVILIFGWGRSTAMTETAEIKKEVKPCIYFVNVNPANVSEDGINVVAGVTDKGFCISREGVNKLNNL